LASFTLLTPSLLLLSTRTSSPLSNGSLRFLWDRSGPPSRAYLKLWEALTRMHVEMVLARHGVARGQEIWERLKPQPGSIVLDLGAAPGGWTWAAAQLGATVVSVDRAELAQPVARMHNVHHHIGSGFSVGPDAALLRPFFAQRRAAATSGVASAASVSADSQDLDRNLDRIDWLLCDIVCYPARALTLVHRWLDADAVQAGIVVTIKLQREGEVMPASAGEDNAASALQGTPTPAAATSVKGPAQQYHLRQQATVLSQLRSIPNARLMHLQENKHEVTFMWLRPQSE
jgi:23S rRNA (cytidine2498-2'-O)-methyltransferase